MQLLLQLYKALKQLNYKTKKQTKSYVNLITKPICKMKIKLQYIFKLKLGRELIKKEAKAPSPHYQ